MLTLNLSKTEIQRLNYERFNHPSPIVQKRLHAVYFKTMNYCHKEISILADVHPNSVTNFIKQFNEGGMERLIELNYVGPQSELDQHCKTIEKEFKNNPPLSSNEAGYTISILTGIKRSPTQIKSFMKRIGMKFLKMGHIPAKADPAKQKKYLKTDLNPVIQRAQNKKCHLLFMDAAHFVYAPFLCQVWCFVRQFIPSPSGRQRLNVLGVINAISKQLSFCTNFTYIDAQVIGNFLHQVANQYKDLPIYIVLDNARYQHCKYVIQIAAELNIELLFLPPYSPNLNLIERLWKHTKKKALYGKYYDSFDKFQNAIINVLKQVNRTKKGRSEIDTLITLNFQSFENSQNQAA